MPESYDSLVREARWMRQRIVSDDEKLRNLRAALRHIARYRNLDSAMAIRMRALAAAALWPEDLRGTNV